MYGTLATYGTLALASVAAITVWVLIRKKGKHEALRHFTVAGMVLAVAASMILYPEPSFRAAERGVKVWWDVVLPALLPFFIAAELLMGSGVVHFMGVLMEPLMRPVFNVPGAGSFTLAMGLASGYPLGAALSARLKEDGLATKTEAERLMCFCNTSDPLFMTGAVAVGMFRRVDLAGVIVAAHYLSALSVGVALRFWRAGSERSKPIEASDRSFILVRAYRAMRKAQRANPRPFGELLGDSVTKSVNTLLLILGFIVLFSVVAELLRMAGFTDFLSSILARALPESIVPRALHPAIINGLFEITIGTSTASQASCSLIQRVAACSAIIAWSGLSVHAQVAAVIQPYGLSIWPYTASRAFQSVLAAAYTVAIMSIQPSRWSVPAFEPEIMAGSLAWFENLGAAAKICLASVLVFGAASGFLFAYDWIRNKLQGPRSR